MPYLIAVSLFVHAAIAVAETKPDCENILAQNAAILPNQIETGKALNQGLQVLAEEHELREMFDPDPNKNLVVQRPMIVMNPAERLLALINSQGSKRIHLPGAAHKKVMYYPLFSDGLDVVGGVRIVGQFEAISQFVDMVRAQALGDRSGNSPALLTGPHGTGKSEFLRILRGAYVNLTSAFTSPLATYTFEFQKLHEIPSLRRYLHITTDASGRETSQAKRAPMFDSPLAILPPELQQEVIRLGSDRVAELTDGLLPLPPTDPDPQSAFMRDEILLHFRSQLGRELTLAETIGALNHHIKIRRVIFGKAAGTLPTIEFQGTDIDNRGLFMAPDPVNTMDEGPGHVMSWHLNGKVLLGHGNVILLDEVMRNSSEFLNMLLAILESRVVDIGGSPRVPFHSVILAATNEANVNEAKKDEKQKAQLDRFSAVGMRWTVRPHEILETLLYMKRVGLIAHPLNQPRPEGESEGEGSTEAVVETADANIRDLFPLPEPDQPVRGPDGRYRLWYKEGNVRLDISPHSLLFLAEIVGATRVKTNVQGYEEILGPYKIINAPLFRSEITRIRMHEGITKVSLGEGQELDEVTTKIREGNAGISSRDAGRWMTAVFNEARAPENKGTVTPDLILRVFKRMLDDGRITASVPEQARWSMLANRVVQDILLERLRSDIHRALASNNSTVDSAYDDVMEELKALDADPHTKEIVTAHGRKKTINEARLLKVREIFHRIEGRPLNPGKILMAVHSTTSPRRVDNSVRHPALLEAITQYYAELETQKVNVDDLYETVMTGEGNEERKTAASAFLNGMGRLGYNEYSAMMALETEKQWRDDHKRGQ